MSHTGTRVTFRPELQLDLNNTSTGVALVPETVHMCNIMSYVQHVIYNYDVTRHTDAVLMSQCGIICIHMSHCDTISSTYVIM